MSSAERPSTIWNRADLVTSRAVLFAARYWLLAVIAIGLLLYLPGLDFRPFVREEGRRALQAIAILGGGSWWNLEIAGIPYINKPPLLPWLMAMLGFVIGSINEWAVRLPSVVAVVIAAVASATAARLLVDEERKNLAALAAGLAFLCTYLLSLEARRGETDSVAMACAAVAFAVFVHARAHGKLRLVVWGLVSAALAAGALARGPVAVAFAAVPILVTVILDRSRRQILYAIAAVALAFVPLGMWVYLNLTGDAATTWVYQTHVLNARHPSWINTLLTVISLYLVPVWILTTSPWVVLAAIYAWKMRKSETADRASLINALLLYAIPITFIVLVWPAGRTRYGLPATVPIAILAGAAIATYWNRWPVVRRIFIGCFVTFAIIQLSFIAFFDGRSKTERADRAKATAIANAIKTRPPGPILIVSQVRSSSEAASVNRPKIEYANRRLISLRFTDTVCRRDAETLLMVVERDGAVQVPGGWKVVGPIGTTGLVLFEPDRLDRACDRPTG